MSALCLLCACVILGSFQGAVVERQSCGSDVHQHRDPYCYSVFTIHP